MQTLRQFIEIKSTGYIKRKYELEQKELRVEILDMGTL